MLYFSGAFPRGNGHVSHSEQKSESRQAVLQFSVLSLLESETVFMEGLRLGTVIEFALLVVCKFLLAVVLSVSLLCA